MIANHDDSSELDLARRISARLTGNPEATATPLDGYIRLHASLAATTGVEVPAPRPSRSLGEVPPIQSVYGSEAWREWLLQVRRAVGASLVFAADGYGLVVEHDGSGTSNELDSAAALLSVLLQQVARFEELTHGLPTVVVAVEDEWLSGCSIEREGSVVLLGVVSRDPIDPPDWAFLARRLGGGRA